MYFSPTKFIISNKLIVIHNILFFNCLINLIKQRSNRNSNYSAKIKIKANQKKNKIYNSKFHRSGN